MKSILRCLILICAVSGMCLLYQNCGQLSSSASNSSISEKLNFANNGGGHSGKLSYRHTNAKMSCDMAPDLGLVFENSRVQSFTYTCSDTIENVYDPMKLITFNNDPFFVVYDEKIYADDTALDLQETEQAQFEIFCSGDEIDFAVKVARFHVQPRNYMKTSGLIVHKPDSQAPFIEREFGEYTEPLTPNGVRYFKPASDAYLVKVNANYTPSRTTAELIYKATGKQVDMKCFVWVRPTGT